MFTRFVQPANVEIKPTIHRITIYPVKSLDGADLQKAQVVKGGCLHHDREYALIDGNSKFINGKSNPLVHSLRSAVDFEAETISLRHEAETKWNTWHLQKERSAINDYLSAFFGTEAALHQNKEAPRTDPYVRNYRIRLLPRVMTISCHLRDPPSWVAGVKLSRSPQQSAVQVTRLHPPLGSRPSLHHLRHRRNCTRSFVRQLLRYYAPIRLPVPMTRGLEPTGFTTRTALTPLIAWRSHSRSAGSPGSRQVVSQHA